MGVPIRHPLGHQIRLSELMGEQLAKQLICSASLLWCALPNCVPQSCDEGVRVEASLRRAKPKVGEHVLTEENVVLCSLDQCLRKSGVPGDRGYVSG